MKKIISLFAFLAITSTTWISCGRKEEKQCLEQITKPQSSTDANIRSIYKVKVDGTKTLRQLIKDGSYGFHSEVFEDEKNFPIKNKSKREAEIELFKFDHQIVMGDVLKEIDNAGYRPATAEELLALGSCFPEIHKIGRIAALGSVFYEDGFSWMPSIESIHSRSGASTLIYRDGDEECEVPLFGYRFAVLRK